MRVCGGERGLRELLVGGTNVGVLQASLQILEAGASRVPARRRRVSALAVHHCTIILAAAVPAHHDPVSRLTRITLTSAAHRRVSRLNSSN